MDLLNYMLGAVGIAAIFLFFRKNRDSKDAVNHAIIDARLDEQQKNKEAESKKLDNEMKKVEEDSKGKTPDEIEKKWNH